MLYCSLIELDSILSIILLIVYGLLSLKATKSPIATQSAQSTGYELAPVTIPDVFLFCRLLPLLFVFGFNLDLSVEGIDSMFFAQAVHQPDVVNGIAPEARYTLPISPSIDLLLALLFFFVMHNFKSFESVLLLLLTFVGQYYMLHSIDFLTFYIALEAQNFCFLVLCGLPTVAHLSGKAQPLYNRLRSSSSSVGSNAPQSSGRPEYVLPVMERGSVHVFSVEASIKYFLLSAFSSGVLLFWFSALYLQTGLSLFSFSPREQGFFTDLNVTDLRSGSLDVNSNISHPSISVFLILCAMMFKLGAAPIHLWVVQIYNGVNRNLLLYISTAPKLSFFGFWVNSFQTFWTDYSVILFSIFSILLGAFGAYSQPTLRSLLAYSTVNEIGLLISAVETAGFNSLFQHLGIYIISQILLWNLYDKRIFTLLAMSLAGLPPLAGFFGKIYIFWSLVNAGALTILFIALCCTGISLVYYIRLIRLFWNADSQSAGSSKTSYKFKYSAGTGTFFYPSFQTYGSGTAGGLAGKTERVNLTSTCLVLLIILPIFVIKPFIL